MGIQSAKRARSQPPGAGLFALPNHMNSSGVLPTIPKLCPGTMRVAEGHDGHR